MSSRPINNQPIKYLHKPISRLWIGLFDLRWWTSEIMYYDGIKTRVFTELEFPIGVIELSWSGRVWVAFRGTAVWHSRKVWIGRLHPFWSLDQMSGLNSSSHTDSLVTGHMTHAVCLTDHECGSRRAWRWSVGWKNMESLSVDIAWSSRINRSNTSAIVWALESLFGLRMTIISITNHGITKITTATVLKIFYSPFPNTVSRWFLSWFWINNHLTKERAKEHN